MYVPTKARRVLHICIFGATNRFACPSCEPFQFAQQPRIAPISMQTLPINATATNRSNQHPLQTTPHAKQETQPHDPARARLLLYICVSRATKRFAKPS